MKARPAHRELILKRESHQLIGICMEVHRQLGHGFLEVVYKDAIQWELEQQKIPFAREKEYLIEYKGATLPHRFYADFVVFDQIILEVKAAEGIVDKFVAQCLNYLRVSENRLGLIVNFGRESLTWRRLVY